MLGFINIQYRENRYKTLDSKTKRSHFVVKYYMNSTGAHIGSRVTVLGCIIIEGLTVSKHSSFLDLPLLRVPTDVAPQR